MTIKPRALGPGQDIGIIAPAGPVNPDTLRSGIEILIGLGFKPVLGSHLYNEVGYLAGDDISRLEDIHEMIENKEIKAIFCARGGYGCTRLLEKLDYSLIRRNPKIIMGYSDISALLISIWGQTGLITFHGPLVAGLKNDSKSNDSIKLTFTEGAILTRLLNNTGHYVTYRELADSIWGTDYPGFRDAIKVYIRRLRQKMESIPELSEIIFNAPGIGYYIKYC